MSDAQAPNASAEQHSSASAASGPASARSRSLNAARRFGYRLLPGDAFSYLLHLRPREWPIMAAHTALGTILAVMGGHAARLGAAGAQNVAAVADGWSWGAVAGEAAWGLALWVVALNGGTLALNSAFDDDEGDIGYLDAPPRPPRHLAAFAVTIMLAGQLLAFRLSTLYAAAFAVCLLMSILYSVPPFRLKAVAGADWIINMWGFGTLTPLAGWAATGRPLEAWAALVFLAFCPLFAALYPLTQLYQIDEDRARGDRTLAIVIGPRRSLLAALAATSLAFALLAAAAMAAPASRPWPLLAAPAVAWLAVLVPWLRRFQSMTSAEQKQGMYAALRAWALTDVVVLIVFIS